MHQVICGCPDFATAYNTWDWEYLRQRFAQLSSTGPTGPFIAFDDLYGSGLQLVPAVATNADGRQEVFIIGGDRQLYHTWELTPGGNWSSWSPLYGASLQNPVAAAINQDGRLEVYVRGGDNAVYFRSQSSPNGGWNNWLGLGGTDVRDFAVNRNADGRLEMVSVWGDGTLRDAWQTSPGGAWSGWVSLGGTSLSPAVALGRNEDGRLESFVVGGDGIVYHRWQTVPSSGPWSDWRNLADPSLPAITDITVNNGPDGRLYVFMMRSDGAISYRAQGAPNSGFSGPVHLYGSGLRFPCAVGMNPDGRLETFVIGGDRRLYNTWQIDPARPDLWSSWASIGGVSLQAGVALGSAPNGELQVFVLGGNGQLYRGRR
jgi:hypothetical protein